MTQAKQDEVAAYYQRMQSLGAIPQLALSDPRGHIRLAITDFLPFEGVFNEDPFLTLNMCTKHVGQISRVSQHHRLEGVLRPGTVGITLPNTRAYGYWTRTQILAIAVDLEALATEDDQFEWCEDALQASASTLHNDPLLTSVMTAMWRDAEAHGLSSSFFEHGLMLILKHLGKAADQPAQRYIGGYLSGHRLAQVLDLIEEKIPTNLTLSELSSLVMLDKSSFSKAFREATGYAPYEYYTLRRMERAQELLKTNLSVTEVALNVGYTNPSKFSAAFRRVYGVTPSAWKKH